MLITYSLLLKNGTMRFLASLTLIIISEVLAGQTAKVPGIVINHIESSTKIYV